MIKLNIYRLGQGRTKKFLTLQIFGIIHLFWVSLPQLNIQHLSHIQQKNITNTVKTATTL